MPELFDVDEGRTRSVARSRIQRRYGSARRSPSSSSDREDCIRSFTALGYRRSSLDAISSEVLHLSYPVGCPTRWVAPAAGDVVVDIGAGAGLDCLVLANEAGDAIRLIGTDVTPEAIARARSAARAAGADHVGFVVSDGQSIAFDNGSADWVIANGVFSVLGDPQACASEAFRILRPGGVLCMSVLTVRLPTGLHWAANLVSCLHPERSEDDYRRVLGDAGFAHVRTRERHVYGLDQIADLWGVGPLTGALVRLASSALLRGISGRWLRRFTGVEFTAVKPSAPTPGA